MELKLDFKFDAAHRLMHHAGLCRNIHGHTWKVRVTVEGEPDKKTGMVVDFKALKESIGSVINLFDHAFILNVKDEMFPEMFAKFSSTMAIEGEPTCENIAARIFWDISRTFSAHNILIDADNSDFALLRLVAVRVWESETASAVYKGD